MKNATINTSTRLLLIRPAMEGSLKTLITGLAIIPFILFSIQHSFTNALAFALWWLGTYSMGTFFFPLLLPLFPWKNFSPSGILLGIIWTLLFQHFFYINLLITSVLIFWAAGLSGYLALNFKEKISPDNQKESKWAGPTLLAMVTGGSLLGFFELIRTIWF